MKDDFLPIPEAPAYEVNSDFIVRNRKTKHAIKPNKLGYVAFSCNGRNFRRKPERYYLLAAAGAEDTEWRPVPSLDNKYELNRARDLRNVRTKAMLKKFLSRGTYVYLICIDGGIKKIAADLLMNEVYGTELKPLPRAKNYVCVRLSKGKEQHTFISIADCTRFLAPRVFYSDRTVAKYLQKRPAEFCGWSLEYSKPELTNPASNTTTATGTQ